MTKRNFRSVKVDLNIMRSAFQARLALHVKDNVLKDVPVELVQSE